MGTCLLCPPDDNRVPDADLADHLRRIHPHEFEDDRWPEGQLVVPDTTTSVADVTGEP